ncbi:MAG: hypothetical protein ACJ8AO_20225, partial [Gemmatimonadaceae bacterium]
LVGGFSAGVRLPELWVVQIDAAGKCQVTQRFAPGGSGIEVGGQPEAIIRLAQGWSPRLIDGLAKQGIPHAAAEQFLRSVPMEPMIDPGLPIQDAIDLVRYLADVTIGFVRFTPGPPGVHGPVDIAAVSYHEGFRWVQRKHYFSAELNPPIPPER